MKRLFVSMIVTITAVIGIAWAASGDWSAARSKVDDLKSKRAVRGGIERVRRYRDELDNELKKKDSNVIERLKSIKSDFAKCKSFEYRVDCYTLCPAVSEDGSFSEPRADWRKDCS